MDANDFEVIIRCKECKDAEPNVVASGDQFVKRINGVDYFALPNNLVCLGCGCRVIVECRKKK